MLPSLFFKRLKVIFVVVFILITAIIFKLSFNTIFLYEKLNNSAEEMWNRSFPLSGERGKILDANNNILLIMNLPYLYMQFLVKSKIKKNALCFYLNISVWTMIKSILYSIEKLVV